MDLMIVSSPISTDLCISSKLWYELFNYISTCIVYCYAVFITNCIMVVVVVCVYVCVCVLSYKILTKHVTALRAIAVLLEKAKLYFTN